MRCSQCLERPDYQLGSGIAASGRCSVYKGIVRHIRGSGNPIWGRWTKNAEINRDADLRPVLPRRLGINSNLEDYLLQMLRYRCSRRMISSPISGTVARSIRRNGAGVVAAGAVGVHCTKNVRPTGKGTAFPLHIYPIAADVACMAALLPVDELLDVDDNAFGQIVAEARVPILTDFRAAWCGPCNGRA